MRSGTARGVQPAAALAVWGTVVVSDASTTVNPFVILSAVIQLQYFSSSSVVRLMSDGWCRRTVWHLGTGILSLGGLGGVSCRLVLLCFECCRRCCILLFVVKILLSKSGLRMHLSSILAEI